tara:strand:+ start:147 stop:419 length:273 start_codon:yes stop_codon:yes gene_type:complete
MPDIDEMMSEEFLKQWFEDHWQDDDYFEKTEAMMKEVGGFWCTESVYDFHHDIITPYYQDVMDFLTLKGYRVFKITNDDKTETNWFVFEK